VAVEVVVEAAAAAGVAAAGESLSKAGPAVGRVHERRTSRKRSPARAFPHERVAVMAGALVIHGFRAGPTGFRRRALDTSTSTVSTQIFRGRPTPEGCIAKTHWRPSGSAASS
jgi:hypothetical protein